MKYLSPMLFKSALKPEIISSRRLFLTRFPGYTFNKSSMSAMVDGNSNGPTSLKRKRVRTPTSSKRPKENAKPKTPAMILNEMKSGIQYSLVEAESVPNTKDFVMQVVWEGQIYKGLGTNKKMAKQNASLAVLRSLPQLMDPYKVTHLLPKVLNHDFTSDEPLIMQTETYESPEVKLAVQPKLEKPVHLCSDDVNTINNPANNPTPKNAIMIINEKFPGLNYELFETGDDYRYKVVVNGIEFEGVGRNKKQAKNDVANKVLASGVLEMKIQKEVDFTEDFIPEIEPQPPKPPQIKSNILKILHETYSGLKFLFTAKTNEEDKNYFTVSTNVHGQVLEGVGKNKKLAKQDLAEKILNTKPIKIEVPAPTPVQLPIQHITPSNTNILPQNNVSTLNRFIPDLKFTYDEDINARHAQLFTAYTEVENIVYKGFGRSKKIAKQGAAGCVLRAVYNIDNIEPEKVSIPSTIEISMPLHLPDRICNSTWDKFSTLTANFTSDEAKFKVLAGVVMLNKNTDTLEVVSLATGTKCINGENIINEGTSLLDCHAEIISKRGLRRFLHQQLIAYNPNHSDSSIFEPLQNGGFKLKSNFQFHLYINTAPCGDSRIFSKDVGSSCDDNHPNRSNRGLLRVKIESGEGTIPVSNDLILEDGNNQSLDAVISGERLLTMSCSDKIAKWNMLGIQGSLLSLYVDPIYISSIIIGTLYHHQHVERAVYGRFKQAYDGAVDIKKGKFQAQRPMLAAASSCDSRVAKKAPKFCYHWSKGDSDGSKIDMKTGKTPQQERSNLCKYELLQMFEKLDALNTHKPRIEYNYIKETTSYKHLKEQAIDYQSMKLTLVEGLKKVGYGKWVGKPNEVDFFVTK